MKLTFQFLFILISIAISAQTPTGKWRSHLSYQEAKILTNAGENLFCATETGLFSYNKTDGSTKTYSRIEGLNDIGISAMNYDTQTETLIVAYQNSNIDLVQNGQISNLPFILRKAGIPNKQINHIAVRNKVAYLACAFGIVCINLEKKEIDATYYLGDQGSYININSICFFNNNIYAVSDQNIFFATIENNNLNDYSVWKKIPSLEISENTYKYIAFCNNATFVAYNKSSNSYLTLSKINPDNSLTEIDTYEMVMLENRDKDMIIVETGRARLFDENYLMKDAIHYDLGFSEAIIDAVFENSTVYIANKEDGFLKLEKPYTLFPISPNGPQNHYVYDFSILNGKLFAVTGSINGSWGNFWRTGVLYSFENNQWKSKIMKGHPDFVQVIQTPGKPNDVYVTSYGHGLFHFTDNELIANYNKNNSPLQSVVNNSDDYVRTYGMAFDKDNNLWVTSCEVDNAINILKPDNTWHTLAYGALLGNVGGGAVGQIIITQSNLKWIQLARKTSTGGLFVLDDNGTPDITTDDKKKVIVIKDQQNIQLSNDVYCLKEDKKGAIWVGTASGPVIYNSPDNFFTGENFYAQRCTTYLNGVTANLLENETITAIEIDGANRKWLGTKNSGIFLMSEDGSKQILNFNKSNSPLYSNQINCIQIDDQTGEVFIGTDKGIISYNGDATEGNDNFDNIFVFPNPVKPDFDGIITIKGLLEETIVKITDISGNLVFETTSNGGTATWDGNSFNGRRVNTGVYLIFCSTKDGKLAEVSKLLFIH